MTNARIWYWTNKQPNHTTFFIVLPICCTVDSVRLGTCTGNFGSCCQTINTVTEERQIHVVMQWHTPVSPWQGSTWCSFLWESVSNICIYCKRLAVDDAGQSIHLNFTYLTSDPCFKLPIWNYVQKLTLSHFAPLDHTNSQTQSAHY